MIIKTPNQIECNTWSGGTTKQLFIYPKDGSYVDRDFLYRISSATVDIDHSEFSDLTGFKRQLMILQGEMEINHLGHHRAILDPLDVDSFDGGWKTESYGRATDFNLIYKEDIDGEIKGMKIDANEPLVVDRSEYHSHFSIYLHSGVIRIITEKETTMIEPNSFVVVEELYTDKNLIIEAVEESVVVITKIK